MEDDFKFSVGVIGYGRFGKLWTDILLQQFKNIAVFDINTNTKDNTNKHITFTSLETLCQYSKTIFLCVPISALESTLENIKEYIHPQTLLCDTCSVKVNPVKWMLNILPPTQSILATHPLFGPDSHKLDKSSIKYNKLIVHPVRIENNVFLHWKNVFTELHLDPIELSPEEHDKQAAYSQGLTHLLGRVLNEVHLQETQVSTKGYDALREIVEQTCLDSPNLFYDIHKNNAFSKQVHKAFVKSLENILDTL